MSEYDGLIKRLQNAAMLADKMLVIPPSLVLEAVDAIENLQGQLSVCLEGTKVRFVKNDDGTTEVRFENRWIPVTERLPEKEGKYLVCGQWIGKPMQIWICERVKIGPVFGWVNRAENPVISHWMPLPSVEGLNET